MQSNHSHGSEEMFEHTEALVPQIIEHTEEYRHHPRGFGDGVAKTIVHITARAADILFQSRYGHRAVVLETIAAVPGMVGGAFQHLKSLRGIKDDDGWIRTLLDEAENERMHLLIYSQLARPTFFERALIVMVQVIFFVIYTLLYLISAKTAHRTVGYFEEEAIHSYEHYAHLIATGVHENIQATTLAQEYWGLSNTAKLSDIVEATIKDEMLHRDVNHRFADNKRASVWN